MQLFPDPSLLPVPQPAPAGHAAATTHFLRQVLPRNPGAQYEHDAIEGPAVIKTRTPTFGGLLHLGKQGLNARPEFVADLLSILHARIFSYRAGLVGRFVSRSQSGVYIIAWGDPSGEPSPTDSHVKYIGMTDNFKNRMSQFASSAGIHYDGRYNGHSAAWRWPEKRVERMMVGFFSLQEEMAPHLKSGFLYWQEALAIDAYFKAHGKVPPLNAGGGEINLEF